jgi:hypothetical protein
MTEAPQGTSDAELARARQFIAAGWHLYKGQFYEDAVSRAYYAVFHAACALLATIGRRARTHDGLRAAVAQHFVKPGLLDARYQRLLARAAADRNDADYAAIATFRAEDAEQDLKHAEDFVAVVAKLVAPEAKAP